MPTNLSVDLASVSNTTTVIQPIDALDTLTQAIKTLLEEFVRTRARVQREVTKKANPLLHVTAGRPDCGTKSQTKAALSDDGQEKGLLFLWDLDQEIYHAKLILMGLADFVKFFNGERDAMVPVGVRHGLARKWMKEVAEPALRLAAQELSQQAILQLNTIQHKIDESHKFIRNFQGAVDKQLPAGHRESASEARDAVWVRDAIKRVISREKAALREMQKELDSTRTMGLGVSSIAEAYIHSIQTICYLVDEQMYI